MYKFPNSFSQLTQLLNSWIIIRHANIIYIYIHRCIQNSELEVYYIDRIGQKRKEETRNPFLSPIPLLAKVKVDYCTYNCIPCLVNEVLVCRIVGITYIPSSIILCVHIYSPAVGPWHLHICHIAIHTLNTYLRPCINATLSGVPSLHLSSESVKLNIIWCRKTGKK